MLEAASILVKSCLLSDNVEECSTDREDTDDNMAHEHCMLDT